MKIDSRPIDKRPNKQYHAPSQSKEYLFFYNIIFSYKLRVISLYLNEMRIQAGSPDEYLANVPDDRKEALARLREVIQAHLPEGFEETMSYGMIGYVVPHSRYPDGYHCSPDLPLPFLRPKKISLPYTTWVCTLALSL